MTYKTRVEHTEDMAFEIDLEGHKITVDADPAFGGKDRGPKPKGLVLSSLAGCTGMDVVSMLGKMKVPYDRFWIEVEGDAGEEHPKVYESIRVKYLFTGDNLDRDKIEKAVSLSEEKYCAVSAMLQKVADVQWEIVLNP